MSGVTMRIIMIVLKFIQITCPSNRASLKGVIFGSTGIEYAYP